MRTKLANIIEHLTHLRDHADDDEVRDEIDNALICLEIASDRLVALDEENEELDD